MDTLCGGRINGRLCRKRQEKWKKIKENVFTQAADRGACCAQSGALCHYPPNGTAKTVLSFVYLSCILRVSLVEYKQKAAKYGCYGNGLAILRWGQYFFCVGGVYNYQNVCIYCMFIDKCAVFLNFYKQFVAYVNFKQYLCKRFQIQNIE